MPSSLFAAKTRAIRSPSSASCQLRYRPSVWTGSDDCWLEDLFVSDSARARGCRRIELDVNEQNADALRFYASLGFTTEPKPPGRILFVSRKL